MFVRVKKIGAYEYLYYLVENAREGGRHVQRAGHRPSQGRAPGWAAPQIKGRAGDRANAVHAAAGYNFALLLRWFSRLLRALLLAVLAPPLRPAFLYKSAPNGS